MAERPILFSGPMVRAILEGRKTQTRRLASIVWDTSKYWGPYDCWTLRKAGKPFIGFGTSNNGQSVLWPHCPYGVPGDRLWVREAWRPSPYHLCGPEGCDCDDVRIVYPADDATRIVSQAAEWRMPAAAKAGGGVPSIHMPRWASRIDLEIVSVRVERLQDLSRDDARAEGVESLDRYHEHLEFLSSVGGGTGDAEIEVFRSLWNEINGDRATWESNPWCWVVEFKRVQP